MTTGPVASLEELLMIPLAEVRTPMLLEFADQLATEPRYFGSASVPRPSARWRSLLSHPAGVRGIAAMVDADLVGVARMISRPATGVDVYVAVAPPWRRLGVGTQLLQAAVSMATALGEPNVVAIAEHRKAPVRALARRFSMDTTIEGPRGLEFHARLAS
jgi:GNAT superfamily N-acetyltransferase